MKLTGEDIIGKRKTLSYIRNNAPSWRLNRNSFHYACLASAGAANSRAFGNSFTMTEQLW